MSNVREKIYNGELVDVSQNPKGCVDIPLLDSIPVKDYIFPILNAEIGLGNYILNSFLTWMDYRIEMVSNEGTQKRYEYTKMLKKGMSSNYSWTLSI